MWADSGNGTMEVMTGIYFLIFFPLMAEFFVLKF